MLAISDQRVDVRIGDPEVQTLRVGTSEPLGVDAFGGSPAAFDLEPRAYRRWASTRGGGRAETTGRAIVWGARLQETVERRVLGSFA